MKKAARVNSTAHAVYQCWTSVPDWHDVAQYRQPARDEPLQIWGIEFLRRNATFREKLRERLTHCTPDELSSPKALRVSFPRTERGLPPRTLLMGIANDVFREFWPALRRYPIFASADEVSRGRSGYLHLTFCLAHPIDDQMKRAKVILKEWQRGHILSGAVSPLGAKRVKDVALLPLYLRVLDAEAAGSTPREVVDRLSGEGRISDDNVRKWLAAAKRFRDRDYALLIERVEAPGR
jgi:hypothetical protein